MSSNEGLVFYYGAYQHLPGEVYPAKIEMIPQFSPDGVRWGRQYTWRLKGSFVNVSPELSASEVSGRMAAMRDAYKEDYQDCGFLLPDGSLSSHYMKSNDQFNLSGNRVVYRSWDQELPTELANTRSFSIGISSLWRDSYDNIISWTESTEKTGTGGPIERIRTTWNGTPYKYRVANRSKVVHVQQGEVVSFDDWVTPPEPYWPEEELQHLRVIQQSSPKHHGFPGYSKPTHFVLRYKYIFERIGPQPFTQRRWFNF